jgi:hypothetical protein
VVQAFEVHRKSAYSAPKETSFPLGFRVIENFGSQPLYDAGLSKFQLAAWVQRVWDLTLSSRSLSRVSTLKNTESESRKSFFRVVILHKPTICNKFFCITDEAKLEDSTLAWPIYLVSVECTWMLYSWSGCSYEKENPAQIIANHLECLGKQTQARKRGGEKVTWY